MSDSADVAMWALRAADVVTRPPVTCAVSTTAGDVARLMSREGVGSVIVVQAGRPAGIVTDRDLRQKLVAAGRDSGTTQAHELMSTPLLSVRADGLVLDALVEMTRRGIHHLGVLAEGRLVGVVSSTDLLRRDLPHPVSVSRDIDATASVDGLRPLAQQVTVIVRRLIAGGLSVSQVGALVAALNDRLVQRVLDVTELELARDGARPVLPYCWLAFGSEARGEQTLRTDQDNGLVYADPAAEDEAAAAAAYYARFAAEAVRGLITIGFPPCPGNAMASNPAWCRPLSRWLQYFAVWLDHPSPSEVLEASVHFDLRAIGGAQDLGTSLARFLRDEAPKRRAFLGLLARDVVSRRPPLTLLGRMATRRGRVDVKAGGTMPLTGAARVAALELGLSEVNTVERFRAAGERGLYTPAETTEIVEAFQHVLRLRFVHQLAQLDAGVVPDNAIDPRRLSRADALLLRDAFATVSRIQSGLRERFRTDLLG